VLGGYGVTSSAALVARAVAELRQGARLGPGARFALAALALYALTVPIENTALAAAYPDEAKNPGRVDRYEWEEPAMLTAFGPWVKALFWTDERRTGQRDFSFQTFLWTKQQHLSTLDEIASTVESGTTTDDTITGSSALAPLVALYTGRRVSADVVDTNGKRFATGNLSRDELWRRVCADRVAYVIGAPNTPFDPDELARDPVIREHFRLERTFRDAKYKRGRTVPIVLYRRKYDPKPGERDVCPGS
jgi:hypothetical protein